MHERTTSKLMLATAPGIALHRMMRRVLAGTLAFAFVCASEARAVDIIFPGVQPKASAGAGQTVSRGSSALFYNPANLIYSKFIEPYADISFANVVYTYQHTDTEQFEPATVTVNAPPVTLGASFRPVPSFSLGAALLPTGTGSVQNIPNLPTQVASTAYQAMDIATKTTSYKIAAGAAFRFDHPFTVGVGLIHSYEKTQTLVTPVDTDEAFLDTLYVGSANQFVVGMRSEIIDRALVLALSYKTAAVKAFQGDILVNLSDDSDYVPFEGKSYLPGAIGFGAETRFGDLGIFVDYVRELWSGGRTVQKRGFPNDPDSVDYVDSNNIALGVKYWLAKRHMLEGAFGLYGANVGDGTSQEVTDDSGLTVQDGEATPTHVGGVQFGNLEAIARTAFSAGYRYKLSGDAYMESGFMYQTGSRAVPEGFDGEGLYSLRVIMLTFGIAYGF